MDLRELCGLLTGTARKKALSSLISHRRAIVDGVAGSSAAVMLVSLPKQKNPIIVVGDNLDDAGYLYYDLSRLIGEENVGMLPSASSATSNMDSLMPQAKSCEPRHLTRWLQASSNMW